MGLVVVRLREWRARRGLTQQALARRARVRQATVSDLERKSKDGRLKLLDLGVLGRLAAALKVEPGELLERAPRKARKR